MHLRPRPLDWTRGAGRPRAERPRSVDVIIPVYGAAAELRLCLESVAANTDLARHRVLLVVDGPQDEDVESVVRGFAEASRLPGFPAAQHSEPGSRAAGQPGSRAAPPQTFSATITASDSRRA